MKTSTFLYVAITTLLLITITIMAALNLPFNWVFYLTIVGQILVLLMVYRVLTDNYTTDKTFDNFYEDMPIEPIEVRFKKEKFR